MMLTANDIHVSYGKIAAVRGVSIEVGARRDRRADRSQRRGQEHAVEGDRGPAPVVRGRIDFDGADITNRPAAEVMRQGLALVLEGRSTLKHMTVREISCSAPMPSAESSVFVPCTGLLTPAQTNGLWPSGLCRSL